MWKDPAPIPFRTLVSETRRRNEAQNRQSLAIAILVGACLLIGGGLLVHRTYFDATPHQALRLSGDLRPHHLDRVWQLVHRSPYWSAYLDACGDPEGPAIEVEVTFGRQQTGATPKDEEEYAKGFVNTQFSAWALNQAKAEKQLLFQGAYAQPLPDEADGPADASAQEAGFRGGEDEVMNRMATWLDCAAVHALARLDRKRFEGLIRKASQTSKSGPLARAAKRALAHD